MANSLLIADPAPPCPSPCADARTLAGVLRESGALTSEAALRAEMTARQSGERLDVVVTRLGLLSEGRLASTIAAATGLSVIGASDFPQEAPSATELSIPFLKANHVVPVACDAGAVTLALVDPFDSFLIDAMSFVFGREARCVLARGSDIETAIERLYGTVAEQPQDEDGFIDDDDLDRLKDLVSDAPVIRAVNRLIAAAVDAHASDIHIEPTEDALAVRLRIDGSLRERDALPAAMRAPMVSRIKVMAGLDIAERRLPQDGRMRIAVRGQEIDLRVATAPAIHGESVVMRILDRSKLALDFASLGFDAELGAQMRSAIGRPHGIVLVTGPTGSGKTTTLYAALAELNRPDRKILTVEDPIEYRLPGVNQTQVNPQIGLTFSSALRSFLRLDPDVMMVGEIRDSETAQIAVQAALTGHLVLSTLHTNSAAGAVARLIDMDVEPFLLSSVLNGVLAQRLVRRLCEECREPYLASPELLADLGLPVDEPAVFHRATGCDACHGTGYAGRIALLEFLAVDETIARLILRRADAAEIARAAANASMRTLLADGLAKASIGLTSVEEAVRVAIGE